MDLYSRRKLVAGIVLTVLIIIGLIVEAMHDKTLRNHGLAYLGIMLAGILGVAGVMWAAFIR
jgi:hypothetical protein